MPASANGEHKAHFHPRAGESRALITTGFHLPYDPKLVPYARELRRNMTAAEKRLWYCCLQKFPHRVLRQRPINCYIVDFYCAALRLVIEIDGESHFTDDGKESDDRRTKTLAAYGIKVVRFSNRDVMENLEGVCAQLHEMIPGNTS